MAGTGRKEPLFGDDHRHGARGNGRFVLGDAGLFDERAAVVAELLDGVVHFARHLTAKQRFASQETLKLAAFRFEFVDFLFDRDRGELGDLTQTHLENILGLTVREREGFHQGLLRLVGVADDLDYAVDVEKNEAAPFEDVQAVVHVSPNAPASGAARR